MINLTSHTICKFGTIFRGFFSFWRKALHQLAWHLERNRPFSRRRRAAMGTTILVLLIVTVVTSLMTVSADREQNNASRDPWTSRKRVEESNVIFSVCIALAFFCATLTIGLMLIWFGMECCFSIQRRGVLRRATRRLLHHENRAWTLECCDFFMCIKCRPQSNNEY